MYDCDLCTRFWYKLMEIPQPKSIDPPQNEYFIKMEKQKMKLNDPSIQEHKHYCEVSLGGGNSNEGLGKFL